MKNFLIFILVISQETCTKTDFMDSQLQSLAKELISLIEKDMRKNRDYRDIIIGVASPKKICESNNCKSTISFNKDNFNTSLKSELRYSKEDIRYEMLKVLYNLNEERPSSKREIIIINNDRTDDVVKELNAYRGGKTDLEAANWDKIPQLGKLNGIFYLIYPYKINIQYDKKDYNKPICEFEEVGIEIEHTICYSYYEVVFEFEIVSVESGYSIFSENSFELPAEGQYISYLFSKFLDQLNF